MIFELCDKCLKLFWMWIWIFGHWYYTDICYNGDDDVNASLNDVRHSSNIVGML